MTSEYKIGDKILIKDIPGSSSGKATIVGIDFTNLSFPYTITVGKYPTKWRVETDSIICKVADDYGVPLNPDNTYPSVALTVQETPLYDIGSPPTMKYKCESTCAPADSSLIDMVYDSISSILDMEFPHLEMFVTSSDSEEDHTITFEINNIKTEEQWDDINTIVQQELAVMFDLVV